jgi:GT2 family glycosyltransferase
MTFMTISPLISVVIATYNRCEVLRETLSRLRRQTLSHERFEVVVVDDGSTDDTAVMVEAMIGKCEYSLRYFFHENRGPGYTENVGIRAAHHPLLLLIADDIWPSPFLLAEHVAAHQKYPDINVAVLGGVSQSHDLPPTVLHQHWDPFQYNRFVDGTEIDAVNFLACNVSIKRDFILAGEMFRERRAVAHEDIELGYRLRQRGMRLIFAKTATAFHQHLETLDGICKRAYERGRNFDMLLGTIPADFVLPLYKIATPKAGLAGLLKLLPRELIRAPLFNAMTVFHFWLPVLAAAEHNPLARCFASGFAYRGVSGYYLRTGYKELCMRGRDFVD